MVGLPQNILSQLVNTPHESRLAQVLIGAVDLAPDETVPWQNDQADPQGISSLRGAGEASNTYLTLQYWPESLTDSRGAEWNPRNIPGGSHPIYQWTHGGERRLSFTTVFTTDTAPEDAALGRDDPYADAASSPLSGIKKGTRDMDPRAAIQWLRYFTYPLYGRGQDLRVFEPPKVILCMPNTGLSYDGTDYIVAVMTTCDVTYEAWFPNGFPRIVEVQLEFAEVVQYGGRVRFHERRDMRSRTLGLASFLSPRSR